MIQIIQLEVLNFDLVRKDKDSQNRANTQTQLITCTIHQFATMSVKKGYCLPHRTIAYKLQEPLAPSLVTLAVRNQDGYLLWHRRIISSTAALDQQNIPTECENSIAFLSHILEHSTPHAR